MLLFGATGQVGTSIRTKCSDRFQILNPSRDEIALDDLKNLSNNIRTILIREMPDVIVNAAAYTNVEKAEVEQDLAFAVNSHALVNICEEIDNFNREHSRDLSLIHFSTDYVFDGNGNEPNRPLDKINPINIYGKSKAEGEKIILSSNISYLILRTSWVVSRYGNNFVKTILKKIETSSEISVVNDQYGAPTSAEFIADFLCELLQLESIESKKGLYHICAEGETTWYELADFILKTFIKIRGVSEKALLPIYPISASTLKTSATRPRNSRLCCNTLKKTFPFKHTHWKTQIAEIVKSLLK